MLLMHARLCLSARAVATCCPPLLLPLLLLLALLGAAPAVRATEAPTTQPCDNPPQALAVRDVPVLDTARSGFLAADVLTLVLVSPLVNARADASIRFNASGAATPCDYSAAAPGFWQRAESLAECTEVWTAALPWAVLREQCNMARLPDGGDGVVRFEGELQVTQVDTLGAVRGTPLTRDVVTGIAFAVEFPTETELSSDAVRVFAAVDVQAAITAQAVDAVGAQASAELFTSVQWPFMLAAARIDGTPANVSVAITEQRDACPVEAPCERTFALALTPSGTCFLTGDYVLAFEFACHPQYNASDCPLQGEAGRVEFRLTSGDLCALFEEEVDLNGALASYLADYATPRDAFLLGQTAYWRADVRSTKVSIVAANITRAEVAFDGAAAFTELYARDGAGVSAPGAAIAFALDGNGGVATQSRFRFLCDAAQFPVAADSSAPAVVRVNVEVTYAAALRRRDTALGDDAALRARRFNLLLRPPAAPSPAAALHARLPLPESKQQGVDTQTVIGISAPTVRDGDDDDGDGDGDTGAPPGEPTAPVAPGTAPPGGDLGWAG